MTGLRSQLLGGWQLASFDARDDTSGQVRQPLGERPRGMILYTDDGWMSAQLAPQQDSGPDGYIAYGGRFHLDEQAAAVRHDVLMSTLPELLLTPQWRDVVVAGDVLTLSATNTDAAGATTHARLVWHRAATR